MVGGIAVRTYIAIAAPALVLTTARCVALVLAVFGHHPWWPDDQLNLSEAAGMRDIAEVARRIQQGEDPNAKREIRPGLLFDNPVSLTPLEAAVEAGDSAMIDVLFRTGAVLDAGNWSRLRCGTDRDEVVRVFDAHRPSGAAPRCEAVGTGVPASGGLARDAVTSEAEPR